MENIKDLSDADLIKLAKQGNIAAFENLIYRYDGNVLSLALRYVNDRDEAKDIYQEVFIRVYKGLKNFQFRSEFSTWLYRITTNVCLTFKSSMKKKKSVSIYDGYGEGEQMEIAAEENDAASPSAYVASNEVNEKVRLELEKLPVKQKMAFILKHYEGYKIREIAEMLDCKEGTVKKNLFDATRKLKMQLEYLI
jgi:RNA polymerase sigma-70 factor, ECF subfamily